MSETARPTTRLAWWQKLITALVVIPVVGTVLVALWGGFLLTIRWVGSL